MRGINLSKRLGISLLMVGLFLILTASLVIAAPAQKIVWTFTHMPTGKYSDSSNFNQWLPKRLHEATGGRLEFHAPFDLVPLPEVFHAVRDGMVQGGITGTPYYSGDWPLGSFHALPGIIREDPEFQEVINNVVWNYWEKSLREKFNIQLMAVNNWAGITLFCNSPIRTVEDFRGKKLRGMGYYDSLAFEKVGAKGMQVPWTEAFLAVQRKIVDGLNCGIPSFESLGFWQYCKYINKWPIHGTGASGFTIMNGKVFDSLPSDLKPIVKKVFRETGDKISKENGELVAIFLDKLKKHGLEVIEIPDDQVRKCLELTKDVKQVWIEQCKKAGSPEAEEMLTKIERFLADYRAGKRGK